MEPTAGIGSAVPTGEMGCSVAVTEVPYQLLIPTLCTGAPACPPEAAGATAAPNASTGKSAIGSKLFRHLTLKSF